jgi:beta-1,4-N-acetylglucosaminyltransferase
MSYPIGSACLTSTLTTKPFYPFYHYFILVLLIISPRMVASSLDRVCLVTVGATAGFKALIDSVLSPEFWQHIASQGFTELHVQCGPDVVSASKQLALSKDQAPSGLTIDVFDVKKNLMKEEMILCKRVEGERELGLVISHAGM